MSGSRSRLGKDDQEYGEEHKFGEEERPEEGSEGHRSWKTKVTAPRVKGDQAGSSQAYYRQNQKTSGRIDLSRAIPVYWNANKGEYDEGYGDMKDCTRNVRRLTNLSLI